MKRTPLFAFACLAFAVLAGCSKAQQAQVAVMRALSSPTAFDFVDGGHDTPWTSFRFFDDTRIYLPARVEGQATEVMLDSGAGLTSIDSAYAQKIGLQPVGETPVHGTGGDITAKVATGVTIEVAGVRFKDLTVLIFDLAPLSAKIGHPTPVILGRQAFANLIVDLDLPHDRIAFHDPGSWKAPADSVRADLKPQDAGQRNVMISIEGHPPIAARFDLGNAAALTLPGDYAKSIGVIDGRPQSKLLLGGVGGASPTTITSIKAIGFAGATLRNAPAYLPDADSATAAKVTNLGMASLRRFRLMTDYPHDALYAIADPEAVAQPFRRNRAGLMVQPRDGRLEVLYVAPGSPAQAAGFAAGEAITAIDGHPVGADYAGSDLSRWASGDAGKVVTLTLATGANRGLTLKDYY